MRTNERRVSAQALDIPYSRNSYIYMNKTYNASSNRGIWKNSVDDLGTTNISKASHIVTASI